ncbi:MAG: S-adenosylmethionine decarboxylase [Thermoanaerobaculia bacterium]|nr:S-adenosylmethionine decarboxylase [Thermoanaerobaculia bacterium]
MASHHFIGVGPLSAELLGPALDEEALSLRVAGLVADAGMEVVSRDAARFDNGGLTLVWILAESHLVLHLWRAEEYATVDLHVCDYRADNRERATGLVERLERLCFPDGTADWRTLTVETPTSAVAAPTVP